MFEIDIIWNKKSIVFTYHVIIKSRARAERVDRS